MSAPETNIEKQTRWHRPGLIGIAAAALIGLTIAFALVFAGPGDDPDGAPAAPAEEAQSN